MRGLAPSARGDDGGMVIQPIVRVASVSQVSEWLADAAAPVRFTYAVGAVEPRQAPVWRHVRALAEAGQVVLMAARQSAPDRGWAWMMDKVSSPESRRAGEEGRMEDDTAILPDDAVMLLVWLEERAPGGRVALPTLSELGAALGLRPSCAKDRVRYCLRLLEGRGLIALEGDAATGRRWAVLA